MKYLIIFVFAIGCSIFAQGRFVPEENNRDFTRPVEIQESDVWVNIKSNLAEIRIENDIVNLSKRQLEGRFIFPLPPNSVFTDFSLYMNREKISGQILDANKAQREYQRIVNSLRDPGLLAYFDYNLFQTHVFPLPAAGKRKIELKYAQQIQSAKQSYKFSMPFGVSAYSPDLNMNMHISLETTQPIADIYSPTHQIQVDRKSEFSAEIKIDSQSFDTSKDFILYYTSNEEKISEIIHSFRPRSDENGYFSLSIFPKIQSNLKINTAKDITFIIDKSGSMRGQKLSQAQSALKYCLQSLKPKDRFSIVSFSNQIDVFKNELVRADKNAVANAIYYVDQLTAGGGTNINRALLQTITMLTSEKIRPSNIVFLTDGLPTEGTTDIQQILRNVRQNLSPNVRLFTFGVGYDVNTYLLDKFALDGNGAATYIKPDENIENILSGFFDTISTPVLTNVQLKFSEKSITDIFPAQLPDLFSGQRLMIFGQYQSPGKITAVLQGTINGKNYKKNIAIRLPQRNTENDFVAKLWANRKLNHLLEQIRFEGESNTLVEEIKSLGIKFGLVTPYTSYLVKEEKRELVRASEPSNNPPAYNRFFMEQKKRQKEKRQAANEEAVGGALSHDLLSSAPAKALSASGKGAVQYSRITKQLANAEQAESSLITYKYVAGKSFQLKKGIWTDTAIKTDAKTDRSYHFASRAYFKLLEKIPELKEILKIGDKIRFIWHSQIIEII